MNKECGAFQGGDAFPKCHLSRQGGLKSGSDAFRTYHSSLYGAILSKRRIPKMQQGCSWVIPRNAPHYVRSYRSRLG